MNCQLATLIRYERAPVPREVNQINFVGSSALNSLQKKPRQIPVLRDIPTSYVNYFTCSLK